jgi:hypothetical protein
MTESEDPKRVFADAASPVGESLRLVRNEGGDVGANDEGNPTFCLDAAMGIVRAMESSLAEFDARHRLALETVRGMIGDVRRAAGVEG